MIPNTAQQLTEKNIHGLGQYASSKVMSTEEAIEEIQNLMLEEASVESQDFNSTSIRERP